MTETQSRAGAPVRIERMLPAPIEEVFAAFTDPESMSMWLSPIGHAEVEQVSPRTEGWGSILDRLAGLLASAVTDPTEGESG